MMKFKLIVVLILVLIVSKSYSQVRIKMQNENGIYTMPCEINGLKLRFILDTGASDISISLTEVVFMLKNGYFDINDIIGSAKYQTANGQIEDGTIINLREVNIGGLKLQNIKASVVSSIDAPLLLGQSALSKLGKIQFDYEKEELVITDNDIISSDSNISYTTNENSGTIKKEIKFSKELEQKAINGDIASQIILGDCYCYSKGVGFRADSALFWYMEAQSQGSLEALQKIGEFYQFSLPNSFNVLKTRKACLSYFKEAADKGYSESQYWLGLIYYRGKSYESKYWLGINQDFKTAFNYFSKAAKQGHSGAQSMVGRMYSMGVGVKKDLKQAFIWLSKAAENGDIGAQSMLAMSYFLGEGTLTNPEKAIFWWQKAADANNAEAQYFLGICYFKGLGVNINNSKAAYWIEKSFKNGYEEAKDFWDKNELWKY